MGKLRKLVRAPSNIALIKYMGKTDSSINLPENASLSMTLDSLASWVEIERLPAEGNGRVVLLPEIPRVDVSRPYASRLRIPDLKALGKAKVLRHVERTQAAVLGIFPALGLRVLQGPCDLILRTANTFPEASGIASSASSFAALTLATALACAEDSPAFERAWAQKIDLRRALARVSRQGSGSSCRSFEGPFVLWEGEGAAQVQSALPSLTHFVILVSEEPKVVSSSEAHARVKSSPLWMQRQERVKNRLDALRCALATGALSEISRHAWVEAWEMHSLFHTSEPPFTYWKPGTIAALEWLAPFVTSTSLVSAPPIVTMDAGPNIHVTVLESEASLWRQRLEERFGAHTWLEDQPGHGAEIVS